MTYLLDTNIISELRKVGDGRADPNVTRWIGHQDAGSLYISALTVMELEIGVLRIERRDTGQGARLRSWLEERVLPEFANRTLPIDSAVARRCARLHVPDQKSDRDALIAATALVHGMHVVTRNARDFSATHVSLVDPWIAT
ncbi:type II toxin-antitoxin system VapC family toxin [Roseivivax halodurans]|uniref:type II toxin-antitoxin system VapC family toxin n=1 Tax=Roseivivax halodurans TaxID=93683 RepID=UPI0004B90F45|nr:type II toxin-antitoxin system VapC family toxin [Roseivivax halodurans]